MAQTIQLPHKINLDTQNTTEKVLCITAHIFCMLQICDIKELLLMPTMKPEDHNAQRIHIRLHFLCDQ